jgi:hypothetical protein
LGRNIKEILGGIILDKKKPHRWFSEIREKAVKDFRNVFKLYTLEIFKNF